MFLCRAIYNLLAVTAVLQEVSGYAADLCESNVGIVRGHKIRIEDAPYMAALESKLPNQDLDLFCGASIIHERFLLTAAHCVPTDEFKKLPTYASMGSESYQNTSTNTVIEVDKYLCREDFDWYTVKNDICLVKLKEPVPFSAKIAKIDLADKNFDVKPGTMVNVTGWGWGQSKEDSPYDLLQTTIPVLSTKCCHETDKTIDDTMICAGVKGRGPCYGDSGGPLAYNNVQIGVISHTVNDNGTVSCGHGMDAYTRVNFFLDWIHTTIANNL